MCGFTFEFHVSSCFFSAGNCKQCTRQSSPSSPGVTPVPAMPAGSQQRGRKELKAPRPRPPPQSSEPGMVTPAQIVSRLHQALICTERGGPSRWGMHQEVAKGWGEQPQSRARGHPRAGCHPAPWDSGLGGRSDGNSLAGEGAKQAASARAGCRGLPESEQETAPVTPQRARERLPVALAPLRGHGRSAGSRLAREGPRAVSSLPPRQATPLLRWGSGTAGHPLALPAQALPPARTGWKWHKDVALDSARHKPGGRYSQMLR